MQAGFKEQFTDKWEKYFPSAQLPVCFYYTDNQVAADTMQPLPGSRCFIHELERVRQGESLVFTGSDIGCFGGRHFLGFSRGLDPSAVILLGITIMIISALTRVVDIRKEL